MNSEQEKRAEALRDIDYTRQELLKIEAGQRPDWLQYHGTPDVPLSIDERWQYADWCLKSVLRAVLPTLSPDLRTAAQTCLEIRGRIWSNEYLDAYHQSQKEQESSPENVTVVSQPEVAG